MYFPVAKATPTQFCPKILRVSPTIGLDLGFLAGWVASWPAGWLADVVPPGRSLSDAILPKDLASFTEDLASRQILDFWLAAGC